MKGLIRAILFRKKPLTPSERVEKARKLVEDTGYMVLEVTPPVVSKMLKKSRVRGIA